ncbi:MAG: CDGSH iron-sulfur domain-containing protein [Planctomycetes bacterium]|nr:CDGSH iron-sulfur domain-containing protein [Planctomycetota bacterium]
MSLPPEIPSREPALLKLEPGTYFWCTCGRSSQQPFCDGAHAGTGLVPMRFQVDEAKQVALCNCKHTGRKPFCDGAHKAL